MSKKTFAYRAMANIMYGATSDDQLAITKYHFIHDIQTAMRKHKDDPGVLEQACR